MSADLVPRWMRRLAFASRAVCSICEGERAPIMGDLGPIWISAGGGGLGSRGELGGRDMESDGRWCGETSEQSRLNGETRRLR